VEGLTNSFYGGGLGVESGGCHDVLDRVEAPEYVVKVADLSICCCRRYVVFCR
jgi:hypothetical protein